MTENAFPPDNLRVHRATISLTAVLAAILLAPAAAHAAHHRSSSIHRSKQRHRRAAHHERIAGIPGISTFEPSGPAKPGFLESAETERASTSGQTTDVINDVEVVEPVGLAKMDCAGQDFTATVCNGERTEGDPPGAGLPPLVPTGAFGKLAGVLKKATDLFRPKSPAAEVSPSDIDLDELLAMDLTIPVQGVTPQQLRDSFEDTRGSRHRRREHMALDIGAPRGTPALATVDGEIVRMGRERRGGNAIYLKDSSGRYLFYYCHLARFARGLHPGDWVRRGDLLGYVGATGNAHGTHLHFSVTRLPDDSSDFHRGLAVNPYLLFLLAAKP